jgi:hypothetical protein
MVQILGAGQLVSERRRLTLQLVRKTHSRSSPVRTTDRIPSACDRNAPNRGKPDWLVDAFAVVVHQRLTTFTFTLVKWVFVAIGRTQPPKLAERLRGTGGDDGTGEGLSPAVLSYVDMPCLSFGVFG